jgi:NitT/TauT family transport system permease protein
LIAWEGLVRALSVPTFLLPAPSAVGRSLYNGFVLNPSGSGSYLSAAISSYAAALAGFAIAAVLGIALALALAQSPRAERTVMPYVVGFQTLPRIAIAPLFIIWFGHDTLSKTILAVVVAFFPVLVNALVGFTSVPRSRLELMHALGASWWQTFWHVQLPGSLPYIFAGLDVALVFSILGTLVTEFVGGSTGLGVLILQAHFTLDVAGVFAVFVILVVIGLALRGVLQYVRGRLLFWSDAQSGRAL